MSAVHLLPQSTQPDLWAHFDSVVLVGKHFLLLPTASFLMSLGTSVAVVHVMMQLKQTEIMLEDDQVSSVAIEVVWLGCWPCCLCGNFEFEEAICVHKQWRTGNG